MCLHSVIRFIPFCFDIQHDLVLKKLNFDFFLAVSVICFFLMVPCVGLHCVIVAFADLEGGAGGWDPLK